MRGAAAAGSSHKSTTTSSNKAHLNKCLTSHSYSTPHTPSPVKPRHSTSNQDIPVSFCAPVSSPEQEIISFLLLPSSPSSECFKIRRRRHGHLLGASIYSYEHLIVTGIYSEQVFTRHGHLLGASIYSYKHLLVPSIYPRRLFTLFASACHCHPY